jgi:3-phosphoinositide dependent protein kinase-1
VLWSNIISYVHSSDLKPENLLLDDDFRIKITDFGTGKLLGPGGTLKSCQCCDQTKIILALVETAKTFVGTSQYVSPELLEANETSRRSVTVHISILVIMTDF